MYFENFIQVEFKITKQDRHICRSTIARDAIDYSDSYVDSIIVPDKELWEKLSEIKQIPLNAYNDNQWMQEQVAYSFNKQKYEAGYVFTTNDELKKFIEENF